MFRSDGGNLDLTAGWFAVGELIEFGIGRKEGSEMSTGIDRIHFTAGVGEETAED